MTKNDLASDLAKRLQAPPILARLCLTEIYEGFCAVLKAGGEVELRGIGTWKTAARKKGRRVVRLRPSGALVRAANRMLPGSKDAAESSLPIPAQPSARIPMLIAQIFGTWPSRRFLKEVGRIAGSDSSRLLRLLEEIKGRGVGSDPAFSDPFLEFLEKQLHPLRTAASGTNVLSHIT